MPLYSFEAVSESNRKIKGSIDADNLQDAKLKLMRQKIAVLSVSLISEKEMRLVLTKKELLSFTREMERLLQADLPLFEALSALEEKYRSHKIHTLLLDLCAKVRSGQSLSKALLHHPDIFDVLYVSMISNAEKTGSLSYAFQEIGTLLSKQEEIKKQMISAFLYPSLLALFCLVIMSSLLFFVIPSLKELFEGRDLHPFTQLVFACSDAACRSKFLLLALLTGFTALGIYFFSSSLAKKAFFSWLGKLPLFKGFLAKIALVRFCRASATLLEGGVPVIEAFSQARAVMDHSMLEKVIVRAEEKMMEGLPLHKAFENEALIPPLIPRMIAIAEQGGRLSSVMKQVSQIYEAELESTFSYFASLAQPILLLILGGLIGFVLLSVLLPLTDVSSFVD